MALAFECEGSINFSLVVSRLQHVVRVAEVPPGLTGRVFLPGFTPRERALELSNGFHANVSPELDAASFAGLTQSVPSSVVLELSDGRREVRNVNVLPLCAWDQRRQFAPATAAFVLENDPLVVYVLRKTGLTPALGEKQKSRQELLPELFEKQQKTLLFCYLYERGLLNPNGEQLIRFPHQMYSDRGGTCVDLAMLSAAVCRAAGLNPVLIMLGEEKGHLRHALVALWKEPPGVRQPVVDERMLTQAVYSRELVVWDPSFMTQEGRDFESAQHEAATTLNRMRILWGVDITSARQDPFQANAFPADATNRMLVGLPDEITDPYSRTRSASATEALKKLRFQIVSNGREGDFVWAGDARSARSLRVGRDPRNHVVLANSSVSREHAVVFIRGDDVYVMDLASHHGTRIGDYVLEPRGSQRLASGDGVFFGDVEIRIVF